MFVLITYDVNTSTESGEKRLRKVARLCERHGVRVQNSVFEVLADEAVFVKLKAQLEKIIDGENDSVRFYKLGTAYKHRLETMGKKPTIQTGEAMIL